MTENITLEHITGAPGPSDPVEQTDPTKTKESIAIYASEEMGKQRREALNFAIYSRTADNPDDLLRAAKKIHLYLATGSWDPDKAPQVLKKKPGRKAAAKAAPVKKAAKKAASKKAVKKSNKKTGPGRPPTKG